MTTAPVVTAAITANSVYNYPSPEVRFMIGTGGSGQSGLLRELAEAFIKQRDILRIAQRISCNH